LPLHTCVHIFCTLFIILTPFPSPPPPMVPNPLHPRQDLFSEFVGKNMTFLLIWDKGSYTGSFLVIFPCMYVLLHQLFYLFYFSSFYLSPFLMVVSDSLRILYSFLYREYINHIHLLSFLLLPYTSHM
jgi:hypothetical protein